MASWRRFFGHFVVTLFCVGISLSAAAGNQCTVSTGTATYSGTCIDCTNPENWPACRENALPAANKICPVGWLCYIQQSPTPPSPTTPPPSGLIQCTATCEQYFPPYTTPAGSYLPAHTENLPLSADMRLYNSQQQALGHMQSICSDPGGSCRYYCDMPVRYTVKDFRCY